MTPSALPRALVALLFLATLAACDSAPVPACHPLAQSGEALARCRAAEFAEVVPPKELLTVREGLGIQAAAIDGSNVPDLWFPWTEVLLNRPVDAAYALIASITSGRLPSVSGDTATWETVPGLTERTTWRLTARKLPSVGTAFTFVVEGRDVNGPPSSYIPVMHGTREILADSDAGSLIVLWEDAARLPGHDRRSVYTDGTIAISYAQSPQGRSFEAAVFNGSSGSLKNMVNTVVTLRQSASGAGELTSVVTYAAPAPERRWLATGRTRWAADGAARADFFQHTAPVENRGDVYWGMCSNPQGKRVLTITEGGNTVGVPTDCAFPAAAYLMP